jgi:hypothetical protein
MNFVDVPIISMIKMLFKSDAASNANRETKPIEDTASIPAVIQANCSMDLKKMAVGPKTVIGIAKVRKNISIKRTVPKILDLSAPPDLFRRGYSRPNCSKVESKNAKLYAVVA